MIERIRLASLAEVRNLPWIMVQMQICNSEFSDSVCLSVLAKVADGFEWPSVRKIIWDVYQTCDASREEVVRLSAELALKASAAGNTFDSLYFFGVIRIAQAHVDHRASLSIGDSELTQLHEWLKSATGYDAALAALGWFHSDPSPPPLPNMLKAKAESILASPTSLLPPSIRLRQDLHAILAEVPYGTSGRLAQNEPSSAV